MHVPLLPDQEDSPPALGRFELLWIFAINVGGVLAFLTLEHSDKVLDMWREVLANFVVFGLAVVLWLAIVQWRSNVARWLLVVPFNLFALTCDLAHFAEVPWSDGVLYDLRVVRLSLMAAATWYLFTPVARAWFRDRQAAAK